jgi:YHS domain-containing protein
VSPFGLDGYCPVTLSEKFQWTKGDRKWGAVHRGQTYLFASNAAQQQFMADPDRYSPVLSGIDAVRWTDAGYQIEGKRNYGVVYGGHVYLFEDASSRQRFEANPQRYAQTVRQAMASADGTMARY